MNNGNRRFLTFLIVLAFVLLTVFAVSAQTCSTGADMPAAQRSSLEAAITQYYGMAQRGQTAQLQQDATPDFTQIATTVSENKDAFSGTPSLRAVYLLDNTAVPTNPAFSGQQKQEPGRAEFFCGVFRTPDLVGFVFPTLPAGTYAIGIQDTKTDKASYSISWILEQANNTWKIAGLIPKAVTINGHDGNWFAQQARTYKSKGQSHNAWLYYVMADELLRPFPAMSNPQLDKLYDEFQGVKPADIPAGNAVNLVAAGKTYKLTSMFPAPVGDAIDLVVKYETPNLADASKLFNDNTALIKALVTKYPELRDAFGGVVARAVDPSGQDYGTLLAMKDVK